MFRKARILEYYRGGVQVGKVVTREYVDDYERMLTAWRVGVCDYDRVVIGSLKFVRDEDSVEVRERYIKMGGVLPGGVGGSGSVEEFWRGCSLVALRKELDVRGIEWKEGWDRVALIDLLLKE